MKPGWIFISFLPSLTEGERGIADVAYGARVRVAGSPDNKSFPYGLPAHRRGAGWLPRRTGGIGRVVRGLSGESLFEAVRIPAGMQAVKP